jgi:hypothetical protein
MNGLLSQFGPGTAGILGVLAITLGMGGSAEFLMIGSILFGAAIISARLSPNSP